MATTPGDPRRTRAWRKLRDIVVSEEPWCWLRIRGVCTGRSTTADHVIPVRDRPDLAMVRSNLRGACSACNLERRATPVHLLDRDVEAPALGFF